MRGDLLLVRCMAIAGLACAAVAQTFVVDAANGPGTHFTDIATAAATVPDGAVLQVRAGTYASFSIVSKGLSVLCASGVTVFGSVTVSGTSLAQTVEVRNLQASGILSLSLSSCQGAVLLYDCNASALSNCDLRVSGCRQVYADGCFFSGGTGPVISVTNSAAALRNCGATSGLIQSIDVQSSSLQLTDCRVLMGGFSLGNAIWMSNGDLRVIGGWMRTLLSECIAGTGSARVDPSVAAGLLFAPSIIGSVVEMPAVVTAGGVLGSSITVTMRGPGGSAGALLVGWPGPPLLLPGIRDPSWLQPGSETICLFTVFSPGIPVQIQRTVPNLPSLRGLRLAWQGFTYAATAGLQASTPAISAHW